MRNEEGRHGESRDSALASRAMEKQNDAEKQAENVLAGGCFSP